MKKFLIPTLLSLVLSINASANAVCTADSVIRQSMPSFADFSRPISPTYLRGAVVPSWADNWFVTVSGGASAFLGSPLGCEDLWGRTKPSFGVSFGKWHTPMVGNRIGFQGFEWKNGELATQKYRHYHADLLVNLMPTFDKSGNGCRFDIIPFVGVGIIDNRTADRHPFAINYGIQGRYRLLDCLHITAELGNATTFKDADGIGDANHFGDHLLTLSAGISWTLGRNTGWKRVVDAQPYIVRSDRLAACLYDEYARNEALRRKCDTNAQMIAELKKILEIEGLLDKYAGRIGDTENHDNGNSKAYPVNDYSGLNSLRKRLREGNKDKGYSKKAGIMQSENTPADTLNNASEDASLSNFNDYLSQTQMGKDCLGAPIYFFFELGTTNLVDASQLVNLNEIARIAKKYGLRIEVTGAADASTGNEQINDALGTERSRFIADYLMSKGVDPSQIDTFPVGGISTYTPNEANRNAIVRLFLP